MSSHRDETVVFEWMPVGTSVEVTDDERSNLERIVASPTSQQRDVLRSRIVLELAKGKSNESVARELKVSMRTVSLWRRRWAKSKQAGLKDASGRGRKPSLKKAALKKALEVSAAENPEGGKWSTRAMARKAGISHMSVHRLWQAHGFKPHLERGFKLSKDEQFDDKFWDVVGLYLSPPEKAVVLCCDEKSQCQALERSQPGLPLGKGHIATRTHDYYRHGTTTLFAALDYLSGKVISATAERHRHQEWLAFLKQIDREVEPTLAVHLILDNYATHKHPKVKRWLEKHPRFHLHFTPTGSSWLNMVERFFGEITRRVIRPGSFTSVGHLVAEIVRYLAQHNENPKRFVWRADPNQVLEKIDRAWESLLDALYAPISVTAH
jgi:transposase